MPKLEPLEEFRKFFLDLHDVKIALLYLKIVKFKAEADVGVSKTYREEGQHPFKQAALEHLQIYLCSKQTAIPDNVWISDPYRKFYNKSNLDRVINAMIQSPNNFDTILYHYAQYLAGKLYKKWECKEAWHEPDLRKANHGSTVELKLADAPEGFTFLPFLNQVALLIQQTKFDKALDLLRSTKNKTEFNLTLQATLLEAQEKPEEAFFIYKQVMGTASKSIPGYAYCQGRLKELCKDKVILTATLIYDQINLPGSFKFEARFELLRYIYSKVSSHRTLLERAINPPHNTCIIEYAGYLISQGIQQYKVVTEKLKQDIQAQIKKAMVELTSQSTPVKTSEDKLTKAIELKEINPADSKKEGREELRSFKLIPG